MVPLALYSPASACSPCPCLQRMPAPVLAASCPHANNLHRCLTPAHANCLDLCLQPMPAPLAPCACVSALWAGPGLLCSWANALRLWKGAGPLPTSPDMCALLGWMQSHNHTAQTIRHLSCLQNEAMSHQQLLRSVLAALANPATFTRGLFMAWQPRSEGAAGAGTPAPRPPPTQAAWRRHCPVIFVDATGWLNLAGSMSKAALAQVCCFLGHPLFAEPRWHRVNSLPEGRGAPAYDCHILL